MKQKVPKVPSFTKDKKYSRRPYLADLRQKNFKNIILSLEAKGTSEELVDKVQIRREVS